MEPLKITHRNIQIKGLRERYTFLHITDLHLLCTGEEIADGQRKYIETRKGDFQAQGGTPDKWLKSLIAYANESKVSAVLLTGDILDFSSAENRQYLEQALAALDMPYIYVTGNHDWACLNQEGKHTQENAVENQQLLRGFSEEDVDFHTMKVGEITFVAMNNSADRYLPGTRERLKMLLEKEENVIVLQHIPLYCESLHEDAAAFWGQDLSLGTEAIAPDNSAEEIRNILTSNPKVKAIVCGHLHFFHEDLLDDRLPQYITALAAEGNASLFEAGECL